MNDITNNENRLSMREGDKIIFATKIKLSQYSHLYSQQNNEAVAVHNKLIAV